MIDDLYKTIAVLSGAMIILGNTYKFCQFITPHAKKAAFVILMHLPPITRKQGFERAITKSVPLLSVLAERAMEDYSRRSVWIPAMDGRTGWWIPPPKPGPGYPIGMFLSALERFEYDPSKADWEQLHRIGSKNIDAVWNQLENREGIQHPLTPFKNQ